MSGRRAANEFLLICGPVRMGKDTGIIIPNAVMREGVVMDVIMDNRTRAGVRLSLKKSKTKGSEGRGS